MQGHVRSASDPPAACVREEACLAGPSESGQAGLAQVALPWPLQIKHCVFKAVAIGRPPLLCSIVMAASGMPVHGSARVATF